jgi:hypothetical protein
MRRLSLAAWAALILAAAPADAATRRFTVVVANSTSLSEGVKPLEYADDDGARYWELFSAGGDQVSLYTVLDADSQRLYPEAVKAAKPPKKAEVLDGLRAVFDAIGDAKQAGDDTIFTFVLVGHGEVGAGGEGQVSLLDQPFTRSDLFHEVLARSPAGTNHVIVDACNSYYLVHARGGQDDSAPSQKAAVEAFLAEEDLARYPNTGLLLSTASAKESHEWSAFGAGVFSHQLRSALAGAADVNGDGRVEYSEVEAFVSAANLRIDDAKARVELFAQAPAIDATRPILDLGAAAFEHWLRVPSGKALRFYLEDARGVRYLDANLAGDHDVVLALVPSKRYYARSGDLEVAIPLGSAGRVDLRRDRMRTARMAARGAVAESFREGLFAVPYGASFYEGYVGNAGEPPVEASPRLFLPGARVADGEVVNAEIDRLDEAADEDAALRRRLRAVSLRLLGALGDKRWDDALRILEGAEAGE